MVYGFGVVGEDDVGRSAFAGQIEEELEYFLCQSGLVFDINADCGHDEPEIGVLRHEVGDGIGPPIMADPPDHLLSAIKANNIPKNPIILPHTLRNNKNPNHRAPPINNPPHTLPLIHHLPQNLILPLIAPIELINNIFRISLPDIEAGHPFLRALPALGEGEVHYELLD